MAQPAFTTSDISAAFTDFNLRFQNAWDETPSWVDRVAEVIPTQKSILKLPWTQLFQMFRPWLGNRKVQSFVVNSQSYEPVLYESTVAISKSDADDDGLGLFLGSAPRILARQAKRHPELLISQLIESNPTTFDNVSFFSASHPIDASNPSSPTTNSNVLTSTALTADGLNTLQAQMMELKGPDNVPTGFFATTLMVPPALRKTALEIANAGFYPTTLGSTLGNAAGPVSNIFQGAIDVIVNPYLTKTTDWYVIVSNVGVSPLLWIERDPVQLQYRVSPDDWNVFNDDNYLIGARRRGLAGLGLYYLMGVGTSASSLSTVAQPLPIQ